MAEDPVVSQLKAQLLQVMSHSAFSFQVTDSLKLRGASNYSTWKQTMEAKLLGIGLHLHAYFISGTIPRIVENISATDLSTLTRMYDSTLHNILLPSVTAEIESECVGHFGYAFAKQLHLLCSQLNVDDMMKAFDRFLSLPKDIKLAYPIALEFKNNYSKYFVDNETWMALVLAYACKTPRTADRLRLATLDMINLRYVKAALSISESAPPEMALAAATSGSTTWKKRNKNKNRNLKCHRCGAPGHVATVCPAPAPVASVVAQSKGPSQSSSNPHGAWMATAETTAPADYAPPVLYSEPTSFSYYTAEASVKTTVALSAIPDASDIDRQHFWFDSGATKHICNNRDLFFDFSPSKGELIGVGPDPLSIQGTGTIFMKSLNGQGDVHLAGALFVPECRKNLISIRTSIAKGHSVTFNATGVYYNDIRVGTPINNNLFLSDLVPIIHPQAAYHSNASAVDLHSRLGHPSDAVLNKLFPGTKPPPCTFCPTGKMVKNIPKVATSKAMVPLDIIHTDVSGPFSIPGLNSERYFITIVDGYTHFAVIRPLTAKSESADAIKQFIVWSERHFSDKGYKVKRIRSDNGGEFVNNDLASFLSNAGIIHERTVPYNSHQNGVAERMHRTIHERTRVLLKSSNLPEIFWSEAVSCAAFLINRQPSSAINFDIPFTRWYFSPPNFEMFRPFGCKCFALIPPNLRSSKFSSTSIPCIFVGYASHQKAFRVYDPAQQKIFVSNQVRFMETEFPGLPSSPPSSLSSSIFTSVSAPGVSIPVAPPCVNPPAAAAINDDISLSSVEDTADSIDEVPSDAYEDLVSDIPDHSSPSDDSEPHDVPSPSLIDLSRMPDRSSIPVEHYLIPIVPKVRRPRPPSSIPQIRGLSPPVSPLLDPKRSRPNYIIEEPTENDSSSSSSSSSLLPQRKSQLLLLSPHMIPSDHSIVPQTRPHIATGLPSNDPSSKRSHQALGHLAVAYSTSHSDLSASLPTTLKQALSSPDSTLWTVAMDKEMASQTNNGTWTLVDLPPGRRVVGCRWVYTIKTSSTPPLYKARLVAQGYSQIEGIDYTETFSPVVRYDSVRLLLAIAAQFHMNIHQMDVTTAFLNGDLKEEIYMKQPPGYLDKQFPNKVCLLKKSIYGLVQAPKCWNSKIDSVLLSGGFVRTPSEYGIYTTSSRSGFLIFVALYVDDLLVISSDAAAIINVKQFLSRQFQMKDLGPAKHFLGMEIHQSTSSVSLTAQRYLYSILTDCGLLDCNPVATPSSSSISSFDDVSSPLLDDASPYRSMVGKLLFAANTVRPDIAYSVSALSRYLKAPRQCHLSAAKHVLRYLKATINYGITYTSSDTFGLIGYSDADWAGDRDTRKSTTGYVFMLANGPVTWRSKKQQTVALSSTEAEYMALTEIVKEMLWLKQLFKQLKISTHSPVIFEDNASAVDLANHPAYHQRTKHIDIRHHFLRDHLLKEEFQLLRVNTNLNIADSFTKALGKQKFQHLRSLLKITQV